MNAVTMVGFKRINKAQARKLYLAGEFMWITPCKLRPDNYWCWMQIMGYYRTPESWERFISDFTMYNCNHEWGYYPAFYIRPSLTPGV